MDLITLCNKINLQDEVKERVLAFTEKFDFKKADELQKRYYVYGDMKDARNKVIEILGEDNDGIKIFSCMLRAALDTYTFYKNKGISDEIYYDTMKCFTRFIGETYKITGKYCFDRQWWTTRQVGGHLYRIGQLEYEIIPEEGKSIISIHIPSDADFTPVAVEKSIHDAHKFFERYYKELAGAEFQCCSWLLDSTLKSMLNSNSNIISFQNRFDIYDEGDVDMEFVEWIFNKRTNDYSTLPEDTSLQIKVKEHLLAGGVLRNSCGRLKNIGKNRMKFKRLLVLGCPGSGKSRLAKRIHGLTNLPLYHLDNIWWKKDQTNITREEFDRILDGILMEDSWIIDGDFKRTYEKRIAACDTIIFLDYDEEVCLQGITERVGQERDDMPWTENEINPELVTLVKQYTNNSKPVLLELFKKYSDKNVIIFHSRKEANEYFGFKED